MIKKQSGFTIIELMIATSIFSLVLMICMAGILQITKMYYKGTTQAKTQDVARGIIDDIGESIRFSNDELRVGVTRNGPDLEPGDSSVGFFCLGAKRYTYSIDRKLVSREVTQQEKENAKISRHVLWVDQPEDGCVAGIGTPLLDMTAERPSDAGRELMPEDMRLSKFEVSRSSGSSTEVELYRVAISVAYGDDDLLEVGDAIGDPTVKTCEGSFVGAEFCAVSNLTITVGRRL